MADDQKRGGKVMLSKIGLLILSLGVMSADSEWLIIPLAMVITGALLMIAGEGNKNNEED